VQLGFNKLFKCFRQQSNEIYHVEKLQPGTMVEVNGVATLNHRPDAIDLKFVSIKHGNGYD